MSGVVEKFRAKMKVWRPERDPAPWWWKQHLRNQEGSLCFYCGADQGPKGGTLDHLIPVFAGGSTCTDNHVLACASCNSSKGLHDVMIFGRVRDRPAMLARREGGLKKSLNHMTPYWMATKEQALHLLQQRWQHPRFVAFASDATDPCLIGFKAGHPVGELCARLRLLGATMDAPENTLSKEPVFTMSHEVFLRAVWMLIELNGLIRGLPLGASDEPLKRNSDIPLLNRWWEHTASVTAFFNNRERPPKGSIYDVRVKVAPSSTPRKSKPKKSKAAPARVKRRSVKKKRRIVLER